MAAEAFGIAAAALGLAATVFQTAKGIRDIIHTAMLEEQEIVDLIEENQEEMDLLAEIYNEHKELFDQCNLTQDLERFQHKIDGYHKLLVEADDGKPHRRIPRLKTIWKAGDLKPKLEAWNRHVGRIRAQWQNQVNVRMVALLQDTKSQVLGRLDNQDRTHTNTMLTLVETIRAEATEVIKVIQHTTVQTRARSLSLHSQVEPDGFTSQTTRVAVDTTSSLVTYSILSPDASLSYDQIKMRFEEYSQLLKSDSLTIDFFTKNGKTIICRKQADKMEKQLEQARVLLQAMIEAKDVPTIEAIHRLCDLAKVLDQLNLQEECLVVGDCAIKLAQAFGARAIEFQKEQAQTISFIAGLHVYKSRACPLFIQAISICEAFVIEDGSNSAKMVLLEVLNRAGAKGEKYPALSVQWLDRAINLIEELPSAIVADELRGCVYINYGVSLGGIRDNSKALAIQEKAVSHYRSLASRHGHANYKRGLALALHNYGAELADTGRSEDALVVKQEAVSLYRSLTVQDQDDDRKYLANALTNYGLLLYKMHRLEDALSVRQEVVSIYRTLASTHAIHEQDKYKRHLALALLNYGVTLYDLGHFEDGISVREEALSLYRTLAAHGQDEHKQDLAGALYKYGKILHGVGHLEEALSVRQEAVSLCRTLAIHGRDGHRLGPAGTLYEYGNTLSKMGRLEDALSARQEVVALYRILAVHGKEEYKSDLPLELSLLGSELGDSGNHQKAAEVYEEAITLYRLLVSANPAGYTVDLGWALLDYGAVLSNEGNYSKALDVTQEVLSLSISLAMNGVGKDEDLLALGHNNLAVVLYDLHRYSEAAAAFKEASPLYHELSLQGSLLWKTREVRMLLYWGCAQIQLERFQEGADLVQQAVKLYCHYGQNIELLWKMVHQYHRLLQWHKQVPVLGVGGIVSHGSIAQHTATLTMKLATEIHNEVKSTPAHQGSARRLSLANTFSVIVISLTANAMLLSVQLLSSLFRTPLNLMVSSPNTSPPQIPLQ